MTIKKASDKPKKKKDGLVCRGCNKEKPTSKFAKTWYTPHKFEYFCKDCKRLYIENEQKLLQYLQIHDVKFERETFNKALEDAEKQDWTMKTKEDKWHWTIGKFFSLCNLYQHRPPQLNPPTEEKEEIVIDIESDFEVTPEIIKKWGKGFKLDEYELFEEKYNKLKNNYKLPTESHREFLMKACVCSVKADMAMAKGETKDAKEWMSMFKDVTSAGKLQPSQMSKADLSGGMDTFGQLSRMVEEAVDITKILPKFKEKPKDKVDFNIWCYVNYIRNGLMDLPLCDYKDIYEFYNARVKDFEESGNRLTDEEGDF